MSSNRDEQRTARRIELTTSTAAGTVATGLGTAKLRDAYAEEHKAQYARAEKSVARATSPRVARFLAHSRPGFKPLAAGTATAITAAAASRHRQKLEREAAAHEDKHVYAKRRDPGDTFLNETQRLDGKVRAVRAKIVPTKVTVAEQATKTARKLRDDVREDMGKAYDPDARRRHRARGAEVAAAGGAGVAGVAAVKERRDAHGRWAESGAEQARALDHLQWADRSMTQSALRMARHVRATGPNADRKTGLSPTNKELRVTGIKHAAGIERNRMGFDHLMNAYDKAIEGHELMGRARNRALLAGGLAAVAVSAHAHARRPRTTE